MALKLKELTTEERSAIENWLVHALRLHAKLSVLKSFSSPVEASVYRRLQEPST
jgi:hypothetical protein